MAWLWNYCMLWMFIKLLPWPSEIQFLDTSHQMCAVCVFLSLSLSLSLCVCVCVCVCVRGCVRGCGMCKICSASTGRWGSQGFTIVYMNHKLLCLFFVPQQLPKHRDSSFLPLYTKSFQVQFLVMFWLRASLSLSLVQPQGSPTSVHWLDLSICVWLHHLLVGPLGGQPG